MDSLYPGFHDESMLLIGFKSLNPGLKTVVPLAIARIFPLNCDELIADTGRFGHNVRGNPYLIDK